MLQMTWLSLDGKVDSRRHREVAEVWRFKSRIRRNGVTRSWNISLASANNLFHPQLDGHE
jgi:hypothetical protein